MADSGCWHNLRKSNLPGLLFPGLIALVFLFAQLPVLDEDDLWEDEAYSWFHSRLLLETGLFKTGLNETSPPLYYVFLAGWQAVAGSSIFMLRLPSLVAGSLCILVLFMLSDRVFGRYAAWFAAIMLAIHPLHQLYSREARAYPFLLLTCLLQMLFLYRGLFGNRSWSLAGFWLTGTLSCFTHFAGLVIQVASSAVILVFGRTLSRRLRWLGGAFLASAGVIPLVLLTPSMAGRHGGAWVLISWLQANPDEYRIDRILEMLFIGINYHEHLRMLGFYAVSRQLILPVVFAQLLLLMALLLRMRHPDMARRTLFGLFFWPLPVLLLWMMSSRTAPSYLPGRHDYFALGAFCMLIGGGFSTLLYWHPNHFPRMGRGIRIFACLTICCVIAAAAIARIHVREKNPLPLRYHSQSANYLITHGQSGDIVIATGIRRLVTEYYLREAGSDLVVRSFPSSTDSHPGWADQEELIKDRETLHQDGARIVTEINSLGARGELPETIWILAQDYHWSGNMVSLDFAVDQFLFDRLRAGGWKKKPIPDPATAEILDIWAFEHVAN